MKMKNCELLPGKVVQVDDPGSGVVRCTAPGLFSVNDDPSLLPPITPFIPSGHRGAVSTPAEGDKVWIITEEGNSQMIWWIRRGDEPDEVKSINPDREVVFSRDTDNGVYQLFWSDGEGIKFLKDGSYIRISPDGNIDIVREGINRAISISPGSICLGKGSDDESLVSTHAAYGERVEDALDAIYNILSNLSKLCAGNPYTGTLKPALNELTLSQLSSKISKCTSKDVKIV